MPLVLLVEKGSPTIIRYRDGALPKGVRTVGLDIEILRATPRWSAASTSAGTRCSCGPSTRPPTSTCACGSGVDAIITNRPAFVRDHAGRRP